MEDIALVCDSILSRDLPTQMVEDLSDLFRESEIWTLAHAQGSLLGPIEMHKIHSSFLTHKIKSREDFAKYSFLIPKAAESMFVPCKFKRVINITSGLSMGIKTCDKAHRLTYIMDDFLGERSRRHMLERFFNSYVTNWQRNSLRKAASMGEVWVSRSDLKEELREFGIETTVVEPFFNVTDYPLIPSPLYKYDYVIINADGLTEALAREMREYLEHKNLKYKFVGSDTHLQSLRRGEADSSFFGDRCSGELAPLLAGAMLVVDFSSEPFPEFTLKCLAVGRPVLARPSASRSAFLKGAEGVNWGTNLEDFKSQVCRRQLVDGRGEHEEQSRKRRAHVMRFHNLRFKAEITRWINKTANTAGEETSAHH